MNKDTVVLLNIGDTVIRLHSSRPRESFPSFHPVSAHAVFFDKFIYRGKKKPDIDVRIEIEDRLPQKPKGAQLLFVSRHYLEDSEDWRLYRYRSGFIYETMLSDEKKLIYFNRGFDKVRAYMLPRPQKGYVWHWADIAFNFLQVLLTLYWARRVQALIIHGCGIKDKKSAGLIFAGESGRGKSTMAGLWHKHGKGSAILNDDRVIVRRQGKGFLVFGSPWNGDFDEYRALRPGPAKLSRIFFIRHAQRNILRPVSGSAGFEMLYPVIFPVFWDNGLLNNQAKFCVDLVSRVPANFLGFRKDKKVLGFLRGRI